MLLTVLVLLRPKTYVDMMKWIWYDMVSAHHVDMRSECVWTLGYNGIALDFIGQTIAMVFKLRRLSSARWNVLRIIVVSDVLQPCFNNVRLPEVQLLLELSISSNNIIERTENIHDSHRHVQIVSTPFAASLPPSLRPLPQFLPIVSADTWDLLQGEKSQC